MQEKNRNGFFDNSLIKNDRLRWNVKHFIEVMQENTINIVAYVCINQGSVIDTNGYLMRDEFRIFIQMVGNNEWKELLIKNVDLCRDGSGNYLTQNILTSSLNTYMSIEFGAYTSASDPWIIIYNNESIVEDLFDAKLINTFNIELTSNGEPTTPVTQLSLRKI